MFKQIVESLHQVLTSKGILPASIQQVDIKMGFVRFKTEDKTYWIFVKEAEIDLEEYERLMS